MGSVIDYVILSKHLQIANKIRSLQCVEVSITVLCREAPELPFVRNRLYMVCPYIVEAHQSSITYLHKSWSMYTPQLALRFSM